MIVGKREAKEKGLWKLNKEQANHPRGEGMNRLKRWPGSRSSSRSTDSGKGTCLNSFNSLILRRMSRRLRRIRLTRPPCTRSS
jgi:hypothetical protein